MGCNNSKERSVKTPVTNGSNKNADRNTCIKPPVIAHKETIDSLNS